MIDCQSAEKEKKNYDLKNEIRKIEIEPIVSTNGG
jgi:hypothetical protein